MDKCPSLSIDFTGQMGIINPEVTIMTHEESNLKTKQILSASLKKYMEKKPLKKITVTEIVSDCNVNRKTFYYHFEDIYALLKWTLEQEAIDVVKKYDLAVDYKDAILFVMDYVESNACILNCAYDSLGREELKRFFYSDFYGIVDNAILEIEAELKIRVSKDLEAFLCDLYTEAIAGMPIKWFKSREEKDKNKILEYLSLILHTSVSAVLKEAAISECNLQ